MLRNEQNAQEIWLGFFVWSLTFSDTIVLEFTFHEQPIDLIPVP